MEHRGPGRPKGSKGRKEAIFEAARKLFLEKGYHDVSVRAIGKAAGIGPAGVSYYFGGKDALYQRLFPDRPSPVQEGKKAAVEREAVHLFAEHGYDRVSIREIAAAAGVNSAAISYYFGGKAALYKAILYKGTDMISEFVRIVEEKKPAPEDILKLYGDFLCRLGEEKPEVLRLIFWELMHGSDVFSGFVKQRLSMVIDILRKAMEEGMAGGVFRKDCTPDVVCTAWAGMVLFFFLSRGINNELDDVRPMDAAGYGREAWQILEHGICGHGSEGKGN